jgi:hypothetical protein
MRTEAIASRVPLTGLETARRRKCSVLILTAVFAEVGAESVVPEYSLVASPCDKEEPRRPDHQEHEQTENCSQ